MAGIMSEGSAAGSDPRYGETREKADLGAEMLRVAAISSSVSALAAEQEVVDAPLVLQRQRRAVAES